MSAFYVSVPMDTWQTWAAAGEPAGLVSIVSVLFVEQCAVAFFYCKPMLYV